MFLLKKILSPLLTPLPLSLLLIVGGVGFLWLSRRRWAGRLLATAGMLLLVAFSYDALPDLLLAPLEGRYPPIRSFEKLEGVRWIVVLGGGTRYAPEVPSSSYLKPSAQARWLEGMRLARHLPRARLVFTGGSVFAGLAPEGEIMARLAQQFGMPAQRTVVEIESRDTKDHPRFVKKIVADDSFLLVTSAVHMPRAMALFTAAGLYPIPAPTDFRVNRTTVLTPERFFPDPKALEKADSALHEYLGIAWAWIRGQI